MRSIEVSLFLKLFLPPASFSLAGGGSGGQRGETGRGKHADILVVGIPTH